MQVLKHKVCMKKNYKNRGEVVLECLMMNCINILPENLETKQILMNGFNR
jgi:hypothetical protein